MGGCLGALALVGLATLFFYYKRRPATKVTESNSKKQLPELAVQKSPLFTAFPAVNSRSKSVPKSAFSVELGSENSTPFKNLSETWSPDSRRLGKVEPLEIESRL